MDQIHLAAIAQLDRAERCRQGNCRVASQRARQPRRAVARKSIRPASGASATTSARPLKGQARPGRVENRGHAAVKLRALDHSDGGRECQRQAPRVAGDADQELRVVRRRSAGIQYDVVASLLLELSGLDGGEPHERVIPMHRAGHARDLRRQVVEATDVRELVQQGEAALRLGPVGARGGEQHDRPHESRRCRDWSCDRTRARAGVCRNPASPATRRSVAAHAGERSGRDLRTQRISPTCASALRSNTPNAPTSQTIIAVGHAVRVSRAAVEELVRRGPGTADSASARRAPAVTSAGSSRAHGSAASHGSETCTQEGRYTTAIGIRSESASAEVQRKCRQAADCLRHEQGDEADGDDQQTGLQRDGRDGQWIEHDHCPRLRAASISALNSSSSAFVSLRCDEPSNAEAAFSADPSKKVLTTCASARARAVCRGTVGE